jgi:hypothetical protein
LPARNFRNDDKLEPTRLLAARTFIQGGTIMTKSSSVYRPFIAALLGVVMWTATPAFAQQIQIPSLQVCNLTKLSANNAVVIVDTRAGAPLTGFFALRGSLSCDPAAGVFYPTGTLGIFGISMNDSAIQGDVVFTTFEQLTSGGKATPTLWLNGRCKAANVRGCHYWLMAVDNVKGRPVGRTFDVVSFLILDQNGKRVAYGTGNVVDGDLTVSSAN